MRNAILMAIQARFQQIVVEGDNKMVIQTACYTYICLNFNLIWYISIGVFMSNVDEKQVKFTSFESYCAYNVLCLLLPRKIFWF